MVPIQIILSLVFALAILRVFKRYQSKDINGLAALGWALFWIVGGVIVVWPDSTFRLARLVGVTRGADLVVYVALVVLFFVAFKIMVRQEKIERDITVLTRQAALKDK